MAGMEFSRLEIEAAARAGRLLTLELEMTRACNLRCVYCYASAGQPMRDEMSLDEIREATRQAADLGARKIIVLGGGEPCLYPYLRELIEHICQPALGLSLELFTNGTLIDNGLARFLYAHRVSIVVKRNASDPAIQDALAGVLGAFEGIQRGIASLLTAGYPDEDHGLGVQTVICRQNLHEIPDLWRWARSRKILPYFETVTTQGRAVENKSLDIPPEELRETFFQLLKIDREEYGLDWAPHPPLVGASCARHLYSILVRANGDICPCVGVQIPLGNIRRDRLADLLLRHPVARDLRHIYETIKGPCRSCRFNGECYGCRGNAFQLTGDYLASDPRCWMNGSPDAAREGGGP
jgi:radical SAM protein with 4Fe4S-binding SPASM domain